MKFRRGFTLLEVLVAMAIFVIVASMVYATLQRHLLNTRGLEDRVLAGWLADNTLAELQLQADPPAVGSSREVREFGGRQWQVVRDVQNNGQGGLLLVRIGVGEDGATSKAPANTLVTLTGFIRSRP